MNEWFECDNKFYQHRHARVLLCLYDSSILNATHEQNEIVNETGQYRPESASVIFWIETYYAFTVLLRRTHSDAFGVFALSRYKWMAVPSASVAGSQKRRVENINHIIIDVCFVWSIFFVVLIFSFSCPSAMERKKKKLKYSKRAKE